MLVLIAALIALSGIPVMQRATLDARDHSNVVIIPSPQGRGAPPQYPPLGTGISAEEKVTLQRSVDELASTIARLKRQHPSGPIADRIADVEVYLEAVRRPLKYDERLYAGRGSSPLAYALQTLATGQQRAEQLGAGQSPWMNESG